MSTLVRTAAAHRLKRAVQKKKATKSFKLAPRDADLAEYKVSTQRALVALRNLYRD